jgi:hypothetical protein
MGEIVLGANWSTHDKPSTSPAPALVRATPSCQTSVASPCSSFALAIDSSLPTSFTTKRCACPERWPQVMFKGSEVAVSAAAR